MERPNLGDLSEQLHQDAHVDDINHSDLAVLYIESQV